MTQAKTQDISDVLSPDGIQKLKKGQLLRFNHEGSINELIITKINRKSGKVYAAETKTFSPNEVETIERKTKEAKENQ